MLYATSVLELSSVVYGVEAKFVGYINLGPVGFHKHLNYILSSMYACPMKSSELSFRILIIYTLRSYVLSNHLHNFLLLVLPVLVIHDTTEKQWCVSVFVLNSHLFLNGCLFFFHLSFSNVLDCASSNLCVLVQSSSVKHWTTISINEGTLELKVFDESIGVEKFLVALHICSFEGNFFWFKQSPHNFIRFKLVTV